MANKWCECDKCDGGKVVSKQTWYRHQKKRQTGYLRPSNGTLARRNLSLNLAPEPLVEAGANKSGEVDPLVDVEHSLESDSVGAIC